MELRMNDEKKVTTTRVFIGDAMAVKHLGEAMHDKIGQKKLTTQHIKDTLDEQSGAG